MNKSPLPLTDPRDAVPYAHRVVRRFDKLLTDYRHQFITPKLTATETIDVTTLLAAIAEKWLVPTNI